MVKATLAGSYPKPKYIYEGNARDLIDKSGNNFYQQDDKHSRENMEKAVEEVVKDLNETDIDIVTDGEVQRDHYIHYHLRHWKGFDYENMGVKKLRGGSEWDERPVPRVISEISCDPTYVVEDYKKASKYSKKPVKVNLPGTSTLMNFVQDEFYKDKLKFAGDISKTLKQIVQDLYNAGCRNFQFDDPVLMRDTEDMNSWGIKSLENAVEGLQDITVGVHVCLGYPNKRLEAEGVKYKADEKNYEFLLDALQNSKIDQISIEAAQSKLDLSLLEHLGNKTILLGVIDVGNEEVESVEYLVERGIEALKYIKKNQLWFCTDCGMLMLSRESAKQKLTNMAKARDILNKE